MQTISNDNFGPLVAYLVPGATVLVGLSPFSPTLQAWFAASSAVPPTIGGFLFLTVASLAAGMTVSAVRWAIIDNIHALTGVPAPTLDFSRLHGNVDELLLLIDIHYRHYQFYANMQVASVMAYLCHLTYHGFSVATTWLDTGVLAIEIIFFLASRDTLRKYYRRSEQLLAAAPRSRGTGR